MFNKILKFLYLNIYALLLTIAGVLVLFLPFYRINIWIIVIQIVVAIKLLLIAARLFSTWNDKKRKINILLSKNSKEFKLETFSDYMQAPCGRLLVRVILSELGRSTEYKNLVKLKKNSFSRIAGNKIKIK